MMQTLCIDYPESLPAVANQSRATFEKDARMAMAIKMFELGRLSSGQAAQLACVGRVAFLLRCHEYGANAVEWDEDEIAREFGEAAER